MKTDSARFGMTRLSRDSLSFLQEGYTWRTPIGRVYFILVRDIGDVEEGLLDVPTALEVLSEQCRGGGEGTRNERI